MSGETYILYVDDSGDEDSTFYSALLIPVPLWSTYLDTWLKFRQWLYRMHQVPARFELHAYSWINAKEHSHDDRPMPNVTDPAAAVNTSKLLRREITERALKAIRSMNGMAIVTCEIEDTDPEVTYAQMISTVDAELAQRDAWALVAYDGDPSNRPPYVHRAHRDLKIHDRHVIEDGWPQPAHTSQFIQVADLVVHCAFQAHRRKQSRAFMWDWYSTYCHEREWTCYCPGT